MHLAAIAHRQMVGAFQRDLFHRGRSEADRARTTPACFRLASDSTLAGRIKYDQLLNGAVPTVGVVPVQDFNRLRTVSDYNNLLLRGIVGIAA